MFTDLLKPKTIASPIPLDRVPIKNNFIRANIPKALVNISLLISPYFTAIKLNPFNEACRLANSHLGQLISLNKIMLLLHLY